MLVFFLSSQMNISGNRHWLVVDSVSKITTELFAAPRELTQPWVFGYSLLEAIILVK